MSIDWKGFLAVYAVVLVVVLFLSSIIYGELTARIVRDAVWSSVVWTWIVRAVVRMFRPPV